MGNYQVSFWCIEEIKVDTLSDPDDSVIKDILSSSIEATNICAPRASGSTKHKEITNSLTPLQKFLLQKEQLNTT